MPDTFKFLAGQDYFLAGNGAAASDNTITLKSFKFPNSGDTITMSDFGDIGYGTLEPGTSRREFISWTGVTQNGDGTATLTGVTRGLDAAAPYTAVAGLQTGHAGNSLFRVTNAPQFYNKFAAKDNDETITETWTFSTANFPQMSDGTTAPINDEQLATKKYVDDIAAGGSVSINRIVVEGNAGGNVAAGELVYLDTADTEWKLVDANNTATLYNVEMGIAQGAGTDGNPITGGVLVQGLDSNQAGLAVNSLAYATDVAGVIGTAAGTNEKIVGYVLSATQVVFDPDFGPAPTASEKDALAGTSGTPSGANKYVTNNDTATASTADKVVRADGSGKIDGDWLNADELNSQEKTAGETIAGATTPVAVYQDTSDNEFYACDADDLTKLEFVGFATSSANDGQAITIQFSGIVDGFAGVQEGQYYYVQDDKTLGTSPGTYGVPVGRGVSTTEIKIERLPKFHSGRVSDLNAAADTVTGNNDVTVTLGWRPRMIKLKYYIQGRNSAVGTADYRTQKGEVVYIDTTLAYRNANWGYDASNNSNQTPTAADGAALTFNTTPNSSTAPTVGQDTNNSDFKITISVNATSATGFTIRRLVENTSGTSRVAIAKISYEAWE